MAIIRYNLEKLILYEAQLFSSRSNVGRWSKSVARTYGRYARQYAPVNKRSNKSTWTYLAPYSYVGALRDSISTSDERVAPKRRVVTLTVDVPYAMAVIQGTGGPASEITGHGGGRMNLPPNPKFGVGNRRIVSGQDPHPFLDRAGTSTARRHPSLRGFNPFG